MNYKVFIISNAEEDILDIYNYVLINDSEEKAEYLLNKIEETCLSLKKFPNNPDSNKSMNKDWHCAAPLSICSFTPASYAER